MASWFTDFASQALKLVDDLTDSMVSQANEAQQQIITEQKKMEMEEAAKQRMFQDRHQLPWETDIESRQILCKDLMEKILALSLREKNFVVPAANAPEVEFYFQEFVPVAMQLLQLDANLARVHAKLSPKMNEEDFWFNFFCRVAYLRAKSGIDGPEALNASTKWRECEILMEADELPAVSAASRPAAAISNSHSATPAKAATASAAARSTDARSTSSTASVSGKKSSAAPVGPGNTASAEVDEDEDDEEAHGDGGDDDDINLDDLDLDLANMKDLELLEELEDLSPEDFEQIGSSECNDELEAQIAQELAEEALAGK